MVTRRDWMKQTGIAGLGMTMLGCGDEDGVELPGPTFLHGVVSGDPLPNAVVLWTRITPLDPMATTGEVSWQIATDVGLTNVVNEGMVTTDMSRDFTVKVDATGLSPATTYYYRFEHEGGRSLIGRTKTAPEGAVDQVRFAVMSCASYAHGYFHAYRHVAEEDDIDAVIHLGDYIYEYGNGQYGDTRMYEPDHEIVSLADYRMRYRQYRRDPDLQAVHQQHPFIVVWDDHEFTNNAYRHGAENHDEDEGDWEERVAVAYQAWLEYQPVREPDQALKIWRRLGYGNLVDLLMLDTRLWGRTEEPESGRDRENPEHDLLGADQESWLQGELETSTATWKVLGQQVMMAHWFIGESEGMPDGRSIFNTDQWDGYSVARDRIFQSIESTDNTVVLTGDIHTSWANELAPDPVEGYNPSTSEGSIGVEFVASAVSSPSVPQIIADAVVGVIAEQNPHVKHVNLYQRGWIILDLTAARCQADYYVLDGVEAAEGMMELDASWEVLAGETSLLSVAQAAPRRAGRSALAPGAPIRDHLVFEEEEMA